MKARISNEARNGRVQKMLALRDEWIKKIENGEDVRIKLQPGKDWS